MILLQGQWVGPVALALLLSVAVWTDVRERRIPNRLIALGLMLASAMHIGFPQGVQVLTLTGQQTGGLAALTGLVIAGLPLLPLYGWGLLGGGDVKLLAMVGAFVGPSMAVRVLVAVALAGGAVAWTVALRQRKWRNSARLWAHARPPPVTAMPTNETMPYAVAIALGTWLALALPW